VTATTDPFHHVFWLASRSAGVVAWLALSASVLIGLSMATRLAPRSLTPRLRVAHERIAIVALGALAAHGLLLLGDAFLRPTLLDVLVPFRISHAPFWTGLGTIAGYVTAGLSLSYYARARIGARRWRRAHRLIPVAWLLAAAHVIGSGSDIGSPWLQVPFAMTVGAVLALLALRVRGSTRTAPRVSHPVLR
jgi:methionine sulfoxide reductase heme-binding subunit